MTKMVELGVGILKTRKKKRRFLYEYFYDIIGYAQPHMAMPTAKGRGLNGTNVAVKKVRHLIYGFYEELSCILFWITRGNL